MTCHSSTFTLILYLCNPSMPEPRLNDFFPHVTYCALDLSGRWHFPNIPSITHPVIAVSKRIYPTLNSLLNTLNFPSQGWIKHNLIPTVAMLSNLWNWIYRFYICHGYTVGLGVVIHTVKGARGRALLQGNSVETTLEIWSWQFQWRNLRCCWLPGRPLYPFVPLACLSMSLISWEKIVKGVLPSPPIPKSPRSASTHTRAHHFHSPCVSVRLEGPSLPCFLADYQVHFNYSRSIHFWLERGGRGKLDRL